MTIYLRDKEIDKYIDKYTLRLLKQGLDIVEIDKRITSHLKNNVVITYTKKWQDQVWDNLMETMAQPGGYWVLQDYCNMKHVEFEHYKHKCKRSYYKGNVTEDMAKKELPKKNFEQYKIHKGFKTTQTEEETELEVDCEVTLKLSKPKDL